MRNFTPLAKHSGKKVSICNNKISSSAFHLREREKAPFRSFNFSGPGPSFFRMDGETFPILFLKVHFNQKIEKGDDGGQLDKRMTTYQGLFRSSDRG